jgi:shikimate kinase/3-dehydroquinate synthase
MRPLVLSGFAGTGKSTIGAKLAARLGVPFVDTDVEIERRAGKRIPAIWLERGEGGFREIEKEVVLDAIRPMGARVVAFGGGTVTSREIRHEALERATVVTLSCDVTSIAKRTAGSNRPLLLGPDPLVRIRELLDARKEAYAECHHTIDTSTKDDDAVAEELFHLRDDTSLVVPLGLRSHRWECIEAAPEVLAARVQALKPTQVIVVTDENIARARQSFFDSLAQNLTFSTITIAPGEAHKTLATVSHLWDELLGRGLDRDGVVLAVGGGIVGDLSGFAAATALRGVRWVNAPTTLLAMVDASIGGKTGFDHRSGKNRLGAFHQACSVVADLAHLTTLPDREVRAGLAEVVKVAVATDSDLFGTIETSPEANGALVTSAAAAKIRVVKEDEFERTGLRALLNLGHTFGHALEVAGDFTTHLHGEAVAIGMIAELAATHRLGFTPPSVVTDVRAMLERLGLPTTVPSSLMERTFASLGADKKRSARSIGLPVVRGIGECSIEWITIETLIKALRP